MPVMILNVICVGILVASMWGVRECVRGIRRGRQPVIPELLPEPICPRQRTTPAPPPPPPPGRNPVTGETTSHPINPERYSS